MLYPPPQNILGSMGIGDSLYNQQFITFLFTVACIGLCLSTISPNVPVLMLTYGVMGGFGLGLIYLPAVVAVGYYFESKRALATGKMQMQSWGLLSLELCQSNQIWNLKFFKATSYVVLRVGHAQFKIILIILILCVTRSEDIYTYVFLSVLSIQCCFYLKIFYFQKLTLTQKKNCLL